MYDVVVESGLQSAAYVAAALLLLLVYAAVLNLFRYRDADYLNTNNPAPIVQRGGRYLGLSIAMGGALVGMTSQFTESLGLFLIDGVLALAVFIALIYVLDFITLWRIDNTRLVLGGNVAIAIVEAAASVALGLIMAASFVGEGPGLVNGLISAVVFSALGLATIALVYWGYELLTRWNLEEEIQRDNRAAAIDVGGFILSMGLVLFFSIRGDFTGWFSDLTSYGIAAFIGIVLLMAVRGLIDLLLLREHSLLRDHAHHANMAVALLIGFISVGAGAVIGVSL